MDLDSTKKTCSIEIRNYIMIFEKLSGRDLEKILFLVIPSMDLKTYDSYDSLIKNLETYDSLMKNKKDIERKLCNLQLCDGTDKSKELLLETLDTIKKYALLAMFGFDKCDKGVPSGLIPEFRKFLFSICEELTKEDVLHLCETYGLGSRSMSAESFMCHMLLKKEISEKDVTALKIEFSKMNRSDLLNIIDNYYRRQATRCPEMNNKSIDKPMKYTVEATTKEGKCGLAVIFNQRNFKYLEERLGTDIDRVTGLPVKSDHVINTSLNASHCNIDINIDGANLKFLFEKMDKLIELWENFGFEVSPYEDKKAHEIISIFDELATKTEPYSVFVACLLTHGREGGEIYGTDGKHGTEEGTVPVQDLVDIIANKYKPLFGKPKLFFIVACRGDKRNRGIVVVSDGGSPGDQQSVGATVSVERMPCMCDTFVVHSTIEGYESCRIETEGTFFIKNLVDCLARYGTEEDIDLVMKRVIYNITQTSCSSNRWQTPQYQSTLRGILKFKTLSQLHNS